MKINKKLLILFFGFGVSITALAIPVKTCSGCNCSPIPGGGPLLCFCDPNKCVEM